MADEHTRSHYSALNSIIQIWNVHCIDESVKRWKILDHTCSLLCIVYILVETTRDENESVKATFSLVCHILNLFLSRLEALGNMLVNCTWVKRHECLTSLFKLHSTLSRSSHTRAWMSTFVRILSHSYLTEYLDECLLRECKPGIIHYSLLFANNYKNSVSQKNCVLWTRRKHDYTRWLYSFHKWCMPAEHSTMAWTHITMYGFHFCTHFCHQFFFSNNKI